MKGLWVVFALVPLAAACGTQDESGGAAEVSDAMEKAGSSRVQWTTPTGRKDTVLTFAGVIDFRRHRGRLEVRSSSAPSRWHPPVEIRIGGSSYWPVTLQGRERWYELDTGSASSNFPPAPDRLFETYSRAGKSTERLGTDDVRGVSTTHYRITLTTAQSMDLGLFSPVDVWVDEEGLTRRFQSPAGSELSETVDFFDFGVPVHVEAPPGSQMVSGKEFDQLVDADCAIRKKEGTTDDVWWCAT